MRPSNTSQPPSSNSRWELDAANSYTARDAESLSEYQTSTRDRPEFWELPQTQQTLLSYPDSPHRTAKHGGAGRRCSVDISQPFILLQLCLLSPSAVLLTLVLYYRVGSGRSLFAEAENATDKHVVYVNLSSTILANISSVSSTLAPYLVGLVMAVWSPYVARTLLEASEEHSETSQRLPTPFQFSLLANMRAGRSEQLWKYASSYFESHRRGTQEKRPSILRQTAFVLLLSLFMTFLMFIGDQFFHIRTESVVLDQYKVPGNFSTFGRQLTRQCITFDRAANFGAPCTRDNSLSDQEYTERENEVSYIQANTSQLNQIQFLTAPDLQHGDLAVLVPAAGVVPSTTDYRGSTLGVSTQCQLMTPLCRIKYLSIILTQFNCTDTFFGVLGKAVNISYNLSSKAVDPDVPGLAWKVSPSLEYAFYSDAKLLVPYNVLGWNPATGDADPDLPLMPDNQLVNPVYLAVAGRITLDDMVVNSTLAAESTAPLFPPTYYGEIFDFFLNCSYTTYDVKYSIINGTIQPDFSFAPTPNGSVAEEWHGRQQYVAMNGDPSSGLVQNNFAAAKQPTPDEFARAWANLYSIRVLSVIGAYTNPRLNIQEQVRHQILVTRIVPWTLGLLLSVNFTYAVHGLVVAAFAWAVSTKEVLEVSKKMDLNRQVTERYGGEEISGGMGRERASMAEMIPHRPLHSGLRVGVIEDKFESLVFAA
jgi:hypothetical protein